MSYFDDMKIMLGKGMNAADRKTQGIRLQAELSRIDTELQAAYASLGRVAYSNAAMAEIAQREHASEYDKVASLLREQREVRERAEELQRQPMPINTPSQQQSVQFRCAQCGVPVFLDYAYCPSCGDNLSSLKQQYRMCPTCGTYHTADSPFCMQCGSRTVEIPIAPAHQFAGTYAAASEGSSNVNQSSMPVDGEPVRADTSQDLSQEQETGFVPSESTDYEAADVPVEGVVCPNCGAKNSETDVFCGECGSRIRN